MTTLVTDKKSLETENKQRKARRGTNPNSIANLTPFEPGISGNPSGRPREVFRERFLRVLLRKVTNDKEGREYIDILAEQIVAKAGKGDVVALESIMNRVDGKAALEMRVGGSDSGLPIEIAMMTPEQRRQRVVQLLAKMRE